MRAFVRQHQAAKLKSRFDCELWQTSLSEGAGAGAGGSGGAGGSSGAGGSGQVSLILARPMTYMNLSGDPVRQLTRQWRAFGWDRLVVIHDELDLPAGRVRLKAGGGVGGHNGLASIRTRLGTADFRRIRMGIGRPPSKELGADYVLSRPSPEERELLDGAIQTAADAIAAVATLGWDTAISQQT